MAAKYLTMKTEEVLGMHARIAALEAENARLKAVAEAAAWEREVLDLYIFHLTHGFRPKELYEIRNAAEASTDAALKAAGYGEGE
jgi:hypothetical protein